MLNEPTEKLNELDAVELYDALRIIDPSLTWEKFSEDWDEFQALKSAVKRTKN